MKNIQDYIDSGILELYVLGVTNEEENREIDEMALSYLEVREEIENICTALEDYANQNALIPDPTIKPFLFALFVYTQLM